MAWSHDGLLSAWGRSWKEGECSILLQLLAILFLIGILLGYVVGRRFGKKEGFRLGFSYAPLELRRLSLLEGQCRLCGRQNDDSSSFDSDLQVCYDQTKLAAIDRPE